MTKDKQEDNKNVPLHVAFIVDGNRRWARKRGLPTFQGHKKGFDNIERILDKAKELGIKYITTWVFSTENWNRSENEKKYLFNLFRSDIDRYRKKFIKEKTRFIHLGRKTKLDKDIVESLTKLEEDTKNFTEYTAALAMDYGGHDELLRTFQKIKDQGLEITKENVEKNLDTKDMPMPDLIVRTGGACRLSGFLSWQVAYSEFYFTDTPFPDLTPKEFEEAIKDFARRERRFGGDSKKQK